MPVGLRECPRSSARVPQVLLLAQVRLLGAVVGPVRLSVPSGVRVGAAPDAVAVDPVRHRVYVANYGGSSVTVIDGVGNRVIATLALGGHPLFVASDPIRGTAYVSNAGGTVSVIR